MPHPTQSWMKRNTWWFFPGFVSVMFETRNLKSASRMSDWKHPAANSRYQWCTGLRNQVDPDLRILIYLWLCFHLLTISGFYRVGLLSKRAEFKSPKIMNIVVPFTPMRSSWSWMFPSYPFIENLKERADWMNVTRSYDTVLGLDRISSIWSIKHSVTVARFVGLSGLEESTFMVSPTHSSSARSSFRRNVRLASASRRLPRVI